MNKTLIALSLATLLTTPVLANEAGWYVGGDITSTKFKVEGESERKTGLGFFAGYALNQHIAFEGQVRRLGTWKEDGVELSANSISLSLLAKAPVSDSVALFGRIGFARNSLDLRDGNFSASVDDNKALFGVGADFALNKSLNLRAEYVNLGSNKIDIVSIKVQQFNIGLSYRF